MSGAEFAGRLRERVVLQAPVDVADGGGGVTRTFQDIATVFAEVTPLKASREVGGDAALHQLFYQVRLRHRAGIEPRWRLLWQGRVLTIRTLFDPDGGRQVLLLDCVERGAP